MKRLVLATEICSCSCFCKRSEDYVSWGGRSAFYLSTVHGTDFTDAFTLGIPLPGRLSALGSWPSVTSLLQLTYFPLNVTHGFCLSLCWSLSFPLCLCVCVCSSVFGSIYVCLHVLLIPPPPPCTSLSLFYAPMPLIVTSRSPPFDISLVHLFHNS